MKITLIRGENIASLSEKFELNFVDGVLAQSGLFVITGPTGAGKSSLLDAMSLALFDNIPRFNAGKKNSAVISQNDEDASALKSNDVRSIVSRGAAQAWCEVEFIGIDNKHYRAGWFVRKSRNKADGKFQPAEQTLYSLPDETLLPGKKRETQQQIVDLIGLNYEQFRRAVLLAQGDFASFLKADGKQRSELLEKMTGTQIYSELSKSAHEKAKSFETQIAQLSGQIDSDALLGEEDKKSVVEQIALVEKQQTKLESLSQQQQKHSEGEVKLAQASSLLAEQQQALADLQQQIQQKTDIETQLAQFEQVQVHRASLQQKQQVTVDRNLQRQKHQQSNEQVTKTQLDLEKSSQYLTEVNQQWQSLVDTEQNSEQQVSNTRQLEQKIGLTEQSITQLLQQKQSQSQQLQTLLQDQQQQRNVLSELNQAQQDFKKLETEQPWLTLLAQEWQVVEQALIHAGKQLVEHNQITQQHQQAINQQQQLEQCLTQSQMTLQSIEHLLNDNVAKRAKFESLDIDTFAKQLNDQKQLAQYCQNRAELMQYVEERVAYINQLEPELVAAEQKIKQIKAWLTDNEPNREKLHIRLDQASKGWQAAQQIASAEQYRVQLVPDSPCPVCGSEDHPYVGNTPQVNDILRELQTEQEYCKAQLQQLELQLNTANQDLVKFQTFVEQTTQNQQRVNTELAEFKTRLTALDEDHAELFVQHTQLESLNQITEQHRPYWLQAADYFATEVESRQVQLQQLQNDKQQIAQLDSDLKQLTEQQNQLMLQVSQANADKQYIQQNLHQWQQRQSDLQQGIDEAGQLLDRFSVLNNWRDWLSQAGQSHIETLREQCADYSIKQQAQLALQPKITSCQTRLEEITKQLQPVDASVNELSEQAQQLQQQVRDDQAQRAQLLNGLSVDAFLNQLKQNKLELSQKKEQAEQTKQQRDSELQLCMQQAQQIAHRLTELETQYRESTAKWNHLLAEQGLSETELMQLLSHPADWPAQQRAKIAQTVQRLTEQQTRVNATQAQVTQDIQQQQHIAQACTEHWKTLFASDIEFDQLDIGLRQQQTLNRQTLLDLQTQLQMDEQLRAKQQSVLQQIEDYQSQAKIWFELRELIGSADGAKFRIIAQNLTLHKLVEVANFHLADLSPRYRLQVVPNAVMELQICDADLADSIRNVESLSGGETFMVSLALALALSSLSSNHVVIDSLFIDEGFGTLDPTSLDMVIACLDGLQAQGKHVGVITHVQTMVERIGVQVKVTPKGGGNSKISIEMQ